MEVALTVLACLAIILGFTLAGMAALKRGGNPKGATGTLGSVLSMIDPATGAPTNQAAAAAREELKQKRHESTQSGPGADHHDAYSGKIIIRAARAGTEPNKTGTPADVKGTNTI